MAKTVKFWETRKVKLPLVDADEVVRLAARAPLSWYPPFLNWLGGSLALRAPGGDPPGRRSLAGGFSCLGAVTQSLHGRDWADSAQA